LMGLFYMANTALTYNKQEKLKSRKLIEQVFSGGKAITAHPLRLIYQIPAEQMDVSLKVGVTVSSRNFKKAVDRNRIKRLMREAYRLNKTGISDHTSKTGLQLTLFIIYTDRTLPDFNTINDKMKVILTKLIKATSEAPSTNS
jgi:ribonuclease P protein component